jgi:DNA-binding NarL/FixJ family response regulator
MGAAFVVTSRGRIVHANSSGRALMRAQRASTEARIASSPLRFAVPGPGRSTHELVLLDPGRDEALLRAEAMGALLGLSGQERRVLGLLANGLSNRQIAVELGCVEKTAEAHVSGILAKTNCPSRTSLVARFWTHALR